MGKRGTIKTLPLNQFLPPEFAGSAGDFCPVHSLSCFGRSICEFFSGNIKFLCDVPFAGEGGSYTLLGLAFFF